MQWQGTEAVRSGRFYFPSFPAAGSAYPHLVVSGPLPRSGRRRRLAMLTAAVALVFVISSGTLAFAVAANKGPGRDFVNFVSDRIGPSDELRYTVHTVLGHLFGLCPCTDGLSRLEYSKAAYHRPKPGR